MFPEFRDLITALKSRDPHFSRLFHRHNELDQEIRNMETVLLRRATWPSSS